jgi:hypothetical protein
VPVRRHSTEGPLPGERPQRHHDIHPLKEGKFPGEIREAVVSLLRRGAVSWRRAAVHSRDVGAGQRKSVVPVCGRGLARISGSVQRPVQPVAGAVAREDPSGSVAAVGCRGEPNDEHVGVRIPEARDRTSPVVPALVPPWRPPSGLLSPRDQARAFPTGHDLARDLGEAAPHLTGLGASGVRAALRRLLRASGPSPFAGSTAPRYRPGCIRAFPR